MKQEEVKIPILDWIPQDDRILVRRFESEKQIGRIIIPETAQEEAQKGIVIDMGEWAVYKPETLELHKGMIPQVGDVIMFGKYSGSEFEEIIDGKLEKFLTMRIMDIAMIRKTNIYGEPRTR